MGLIAAGGLVLVTGVVGGGGAAPAVPGGVKLAAQRVSPPSTGSGSDTTGGSSDYKWVSSSRVGGKAKRPDLGKLTTPTRRVVRNKDGSLSMQISLGPVRVKDASGHWKKADGKVEQKADGRLGPKVNPVPLTVASQAGSKPIAPTSRGPPFGKSVSIGISSSPHRSESSDSGALVVLPTPAGNMSLSHPDAYAVDGQVNGDQVTYPDALPGGRDLVEQMLPRGVEERVVLPDASTNSYDVVVDTPAGTEPQEVPGGILFVDSDHTSHVVAAYGGGHAYDATQADLPPVGPPVEISIADRTGQRVRLHVSIDAAWLRDPARVFPVTIDPVAWTQQQTGPGGSWGSLISDTFVQSSAPTSSFWSDASLYSGTVYFGGWHTWLAYSYFDVTGLRDGHEGVDEAHVTYVQNGSGSLNGCTAPMQLFHDTTWNGPWTTWNNMSQWDGYAGVPTVGGVGCGVGYLNVDATDPVYLWVDQNGPVNGLMLYNNWLGYDQSYKKYASGDTYLPPTLVVNYTNYNASYASTRPTGSTTPWTRVEGQGSQIPVKITNTSTTQDWQANGDIQLGCHIKKLDGTAVTDCPLTKLPRTILAGQHDTIDASVPGLDPGDYNITWDLAKTVTTNGQVGIQHYFSERSVPVSTAERLSVVSGNAYARGDNPYVKFAGGVNTATGTYYFDATDAMVATIGPALAVTRAYNHRDPRDPSTSAFGQGWSSSYEITATADDNGDFTVRYPDGRLEAYSKKADGTYAPPTGFYASFVVNGDGTATLTDKDQTVYSFDTQTNHGRLTKITDENGRDVTLTYSGTQLQTVTAHPSGRALHYEWSSSGHISAVSTDPVSRNGQSPAALQWTYHYAGDKLTSVCDPKNGPSACETYGYDASSRITNIVRPRGNNAITITYTPPGPFENNVATTRVGTDAVSTNYGYSAPVAPAVSLCQAAGIALPKLSVTVTDPRNNTSIAEYDAQKHLVCHRDALLHTHSYLYDATRGFLTQDTDENGIITKYGYDPNDTQLRGNVVDKTDGNGMHTYYTYNSRDKILTTSDGRSANAADPTYRTTNVYDASGTNLVEVDPPTVPSSPLVPMTWVYSNGSGGVQQAGCASTGDATGGGVVPKGLMLCEQKPGQNPTVNYYNTNGDLVQRTDPSGQVTNFEYDALGLETRETLHWLNGDQSSGQAVTETISDELGQPTSVTAPAVTDPITGQVHQLRTATTYDPNGNVTSVTTSDVGGSAIPDADRTTTHTFDDADREASTSYLPVAQGGSMPREFDAAGNVKAVTDQLGRRIQTTYTPLNQPDTVTLIGADANAMPAAANLTLQHFTYDAGGRTTSTFDALNRETRVAYDNEDRPLTKILYNNNTQVSVLESHTYDPAGNETQTSTANNTQVLTKTYLPNNLAPRTTFDPNGLKRVTDTSYDTAGRPTSIRRSINGAGTTEETRYTYATDSGLKSTETVENGTTDLTTTFGYDTRGLLVATTDPNNNTTNTTFDAVGRPSQTLQPAVAIDGGTPDRPTTTTGYTTFGEQAQTKDPNGNITSTGYDQLGRKILIQHPAYTPPGGQALNPTESYTYDLVGNTTSSVDRRGQTTSYTFDLLNRVRTKTDPAVQGNAAGVTTYAYDVAGNQTSVTDQNSITTTAVFDPRNRKTSSTVSGFLATNYGYDDRNNQNSVTPPGLTATTAVFNAANEQTSSTAPGSAATTTTYDLAGRPLVTTDPLGHSTTNTYDLAGRKLTQTQAGSGVSVATSYAYDSDGNQTTVTAPNGANTTYAYDAANRLTTVTEPIASGQTMTTTYAYDRAGNTTQLTDGNGNTTQVTYNSWNLPETRTEPSTTGQDDLSLRQYTTTYDAGGLPVQDNQPGGVVVARTFDALGRVTQEAGSGGNAPAATRTFGYDPGGRRTNVSQSNGTITFGYDNRGLLTTTTGASGSSTFGYDATGRLNSRTDGAGNATFTWDNRSNLATETDPLTNTLRTNTWDNNDQLTKVAYGTNPNNDSPTRTLTYDGIGRLKDDKLTTPSSTVRYETSYDYDPNSNVTKQTIAPAGVASAGQNTYTYDQSDRLTSWTKPDTTTVAYGYDKAGNRTQAAGVTYTYDARNRLTTASDQRSWTWTPRGTLATATTAQGTTSDTFDALGRLTQDGGSTYTYDGLDRVTSRTANSATTNFTYAGTEQDPTTSGTWNFARSPSGDLLALDDTATPTVPAAIAGRNRHGDLTDLYTPAGALTDTAAYDPFGAVTATTGTTAPPVGFQSDYTDPATGQVWMGARWYDPAIDTFDSRDTAAGQLKAPISLNQYTYANDDPLTYFDPDGHKPSKAQQQLAVWRAIAKTGFWSQLYKNLVFALAAKKTAPQSFPKGPPVVVKWNAKTGTYVVNAQPYFVNTVKAIQAATKPPSVIVRARAIIPTVTIKHDGKGNPVHSNVDPGRLVLTTTLAIVKPSKASAVKGREAALCGNSMGIGGQTSAAVRSVCNDNSLYVRTNKTGSTGDPIGDALDAAVSPFRSAVSASADWVGDTNNNANQFLKQLCGQACQHRPDTFPTPVTQPQPQPESPGAYVGQHYSQQLQTAIGNHALQACLFGVATLALSVPWSTVAGWAINLRSYYETQQACSPGR